jgi:hypothetical protein
MLTRRFFVKGSAPGAEKKARWEQLDPDPPFHGRRWLESGPQWPPGYLNAGRAVVVL